MVTMANSDIAKIIKYFYSRFILRDFLGKIIPGSLFLIIISLSVIEVGDAVKYYGYLKHFWIWLIFIGFSWLTGFAIQGIGTYKKIFILYYPKKIEYEEGEKKYGEFIEKANDEQRTLHERFVVLKEACGNGYFSLLLSLIFIATSIHISVLSEKYNSILYYLFKNNTNIVYLLIIVLIFLILGLFRIHRESVENQWRTQESILQE